MGDFMKGFAQGAVGFGIPYLFQTMKEDRAQERQDKRDRITNEHWEKTYALNKKAAEQRSAINQAQLNEAKLRAQGQKLRQIHDQVSRQLVVSDGDPNLFAQAMSVDQLNADHHTWKYLGTDDTGRVHFRVTAKDTGEDTDIYYKNKDDYLQAVTRFIDPQFWAASQKAKAKLQNQIKLAKTKHKNRLDEIQASRDAQIGVAAFRAKHPPSARQPKAQSKGTGKTSQRELLGVPWTRSELQLVAQAYTDYVKRQEDAGKPVAPRAQFYTQYYKSVLHPEIGNNQGGPGITQYAPGTIVRQKSTGKTFRVDDNGYLRPYIPGFPDAMMPSHK